MNGKEFRLTRFLSTSKKLVISAIDHGASLGPIKGLENPVEACASLTETDGVLMSAGMIQHVIDQFTHRGAPWLITRLVWNSTYCFQWDHSESHHRPLMTVADAVAKGADIVLASLAINTGSEKVDAENAGIFGQCVQQAQQLGIPIIGEYFPAKVEQMSPEQLHDNIRIGTRVIAELGADMIKTFYTGPKFNEIVASTPVPIFVLGAEKTPTESDALTLAKNAATAGAKGIVFGRNIFQSCNPAGFVKAVKAVMNNEIGIEEALTKYGLE